MLPPKLITISINTTLQVSPEALATLLLSGSDNIVVRSIYGLTQEGLLGERIEHPAQEELPIPGDLPPLVNVPQAAPEEPPQAPVEDVAPPAPAPAKKPARAARAAPVEAPRPNGVHVVEPVVKMPPAPPSEEDLRALLVVLANKAPTRNQAVIALLEEVGGAPKLLSCPVERWGDIEAAAREAIEAHSAR